MFTTWCRGGSYVYKEADFFSRPLPKAGRELQTELNRIMRDDDDGPLAKNQPEASLRAVSQL